MPCLDREAIEERRARVAALTREGCSAREIAVELRITERSVVRIRHRLGISLCRPSTPLTDWQRRTARELLADGCSYAEAARTVGCSDDTVAHHFPGRGWTRQESGEFAAAVRLANQRLKAVSV